MLTQASVAIDGSKFKAVNNRDKNFTRAKMERRLAQIDESVARYLSQLDTADLQEPSEALAAKTAHLKGKLAKLASELQRLKAIGRELSHVDFEAVHLFVPFRHLWLFGEYASRIHEWGRQAVPVDWFAEHLDFMLSWENEKLVPGLL